MPSGNVSSIAATTAAVNSLPPMFANPLTTDRPVMPMRDTQVT